MIDNHIAKGAEITIATIPVNKKDGTSFGILKADNDQNITSFVAQIAISTNRSCRASPLLVIA